MYFDDNLTTKRYVLTEFIGIGQNIATQIKEKRKTPEALIYQGFRGVFFNGVPVRLRAWGKEEQGSAAHAFLFAKRKAEQSGLCSDVVGMAGLEPAKCRSQSPVVDRIKSGFLKHLRHFYDKKYIIKASGKVRIQTPFPFVRPRHGTHCQEARRGLDHEQYYSVLIRYFQWVVDLPVYSAYNRL